MDWANQGTRITGNIIYDTGAANIFVEMDHGPILIDNNVLIGRGVRSNSEGDIFAHNLFVDCEFDMGSDTGRQSEYYRPHTRKIVKRKVGVPQDDKWFNNIFVGRGLDGVKAASGYAADYNVFLGGAKKSTFGDEHSVVAAAGADVTRKETPLGVTIEFSIPEPCLPRRRAVGGRQARGRSAHHRPDHRGPLRQAHHGGHGPDGRAARATDPRPPGRAEARSQPHRVDVETRESDN